MSFEIMVERLYADILKVEVRQASPRPTGGAQDVQKQPEATVLKDSFESASTGLNSPPAVRENESPNAASSQQPIEGERPQQQEPGSGRAAEKPLSAIGNERSRRSELFSMIANLQSSSPTSTPRRQGLKTPPHLRNLRDPYPETRDLPTPTATAENDIFLGSSPTPGTRDRTQVSEMSASLAARGDHINMDPPSSPPEHQSLSPNVRNQAGTPQLSATRSPRAGDKEVARTKGKAISKEPAVSTSTPETNRKASRDKIDDNGNQDPTSKRSAERPRSTKGRFVKSPHRREPDTTPTREPRDRTRVQEAEYGADDTVPASKSAAKNNKTRIQRSESGSGTRSAGVSDTNGPSTDEMETQIASQLEQDLELAVDKNETASAEQSELPSTYPMTKKRKRGVELAHTPPTKEKRRSSRRVSNKDATADADIGTIHTRRSVITRSAPKPSDESSPVERGLQKRKGRSEATSDPAPPEPADQSQGTDDDVEKSAESAEPSQKRRKSSRLSGHTDSQASEDGPSQSKTPLNRSRKRGRNKANKSRKSLQNSEVSTEPTQTSNSDKHELHGLPGVDITQASSEAPEQAHENLPDPSTDNEGGAAQEVAEMQNSETGADNAANQLTEDRIVEQGIQAESNEGDAAILRSLRGVLGDVKLASLDMDTLKEVDNLLFEIRVQAHDALRRQSG
jgi:hypothetical protein